MTGSDEYLRYSHTTPDKAFGPNEQLTPIASAPIPSSMATIADGDAPVISLPSSPYAFDTNTGKSEHSFAARSAAFVS